MDPRSERPGSTAFPLVGLVLGVMLLTLASTMPIVRCPACLQSLRMYISRACNSHGTAFPPPNPGASELIRRWNLTQGGSCPYCEGRHRVTPLKRIIQAVPEGF